MTTTTTTTTKRATNTRSSRTGNFFDELLEEAVANEARMSPSSLKPRLDRFGLPLPTEESVFPPLSIDVVRVPINDRGGRNPFNRSYVEEMTIRHLGVNLDAFDDVGHSIHKEQGGRSHWSLKMMHWDPPVIGVDNFLTSDECTYLLSLVDSSTWTSTSGEPVPVQRMPSPTFSSSLSEESSVISRRTSTTWFCRYDAVPTLLAKASHLLNVDIARMEEPQIVKYQPGQEFSWHYDEVPRRTTAQQQQAMIENGGQRVATLLVYLNDIQEGRGGGTAFRDLLGPPPEDDDSMGQQRQRLVLTPRKGTSLLFFPSYVDGMPDHRTLHSGEVAMDEKTIVQLWVHERDYRAGVPEGNSQSDAFDLVKGEAGQFGFLL